MRTSLLIPAVLVGVACARSARGADASPPAQTAQVAQDAQAAQAAPAAPGAQTTQTDEKRARPPVVIWPTLTPAGDAPGASALHRPQPISDKDVYERAFELDVTLRDAVQDLGFMLYVTEAGPRPGRTRDEDLIARASDSAAGGASEGGTWVVSPRIEAAGGGEYVVRIVVVPPNGHELRVRVETVAADSVNVRGLVMLRDLLSTTTATRAALENEREQDARGTTQGITAPPRSEGRAVLAVNAGLFGGFAAFSIQNASGSTDPRVLYPLLALGTGIGIGAALLVADEWDVSVGDAWVLSAGAGWGAASALLITAGINLQPFDDRYSWGVGGGLIGATLATLALTRGHMDEGDAVLVHSGSALGLLAGGATELLYRGTSVPGTTPYTGMGYGTAIGFVAASALATQVTVSPSRVLLLDVGVGAGALVGAAAGSPLIFQNATPGRTRGWLATTLGGSVAGGVTAWLLTRDSPARRTKHSWLPGEPSVGIVGTSSNAQRQTPVYGVAWSGSF